MAKSEQHGEMKVKCNVCGKDKTVAVTSFYQKGGLRGGCCVSTLETKLGTVTIPCSYSTIPSATKRQTHKASRDKVARSSRK